MNDVTASTAADGGQISARAAGTDLAAESKSSSNKTKTVSVTTLKEKILDLSVSSSELSDLFVRAAATSQQLSPLDEQAIAAAMEQRNELTTLLSNIFRSMADAANSIIRNVRP